MTYIGAIFIFQDIVHCQGIILERLHGIVLDGPEYNHIRILLCIRCGLDKVVPYSLYIRWCPGARLSSTPYPNTNIVRFCYHEPPPLFPSGWCYAALDDGRDACSFARSD
jgi:hypothetical protein